MNIADIPKINTALAEWLSCLVFVLVMKKRWNHRKTAGILAVFLAAFCVLQYYIGVWPVAGGILDPGDGVRYAADVPVHRHVLRDHGSGGSAVLFRGIYVGGVCGVYRVAAVFVCSSRGIRGAAF